MDGTTKARRLAGSAVFWQQFETVEPEPPSVEDLDALQRLMPPLELVVTDGLEDLVDRT